VIHDAILTTIRDALQAALIDDIPSDDQARAGVVFLGPLQGEPDPESARISVTLHENDPDIVYKPGSTGMTDSWQDEVAEIECGAAITWKRRFSVKARCLLESSGENLASARTIASTLRSRIETALLGIPFNDIQAEGGEYVAKRILSDAIQGEMIQAGGPPDAYDYYIKVRFQVETTTGVTV
jgi:hypothetical protein